MPKCVYCGKEYDSPRGLTLVMNDGTINYLCSSKCRKNMSMKRRKVHWISKKKKSKEDVKEEMIKRAKEEKQKAVEEKEAKKEK